MTWEQHIKDGIKALDQRNYLIAETSFGSALDYARKGFRHVDPRIPETFGYLGQALLLQKKVTEAAPALRQSVNIARSLKKMSVAIATAEYLYAYIDYQSPDADERRNTAVIQLKGYLSEDAINQLTNELKNLFTVKPPEPEVKTESMSDSSMEQNKPEAVRQAEPLSETKSESAVVAMEQNNSPPVVDQEKYSAWAKRLNVAIIKAKSSNLAQLTTGYLELHELLTETLSLYASPHSAIADHLGSMGGAAAEIGLFARSEQLFRLAIRQMEQARGEKNPATALLQLKLANVYRAHEAYHEADIYFLLAMEVLGSANNIDQLLLNDTAELFKHMHQRAKVESTSLKLFNEVTRLEQSGELHEAHEKALLAQSLLAEQFTEDHPHFAVLCRHHAKVLNKKGQFTEAENLIARACLVERIQTEREIYYKLLDQGLPPIPAVINARY